MANLKVTLTEPLLNGMDVRFKAPCACSSISKLVVRAPDNDGNMGEQEFTFRDAHGNALTDLGNLFSEGVLVKVMVDTETGSAYIQNADTNKYLEDKIANAGSKITLSPAVNSTSTTTAATSSAVKQAYDRAASHLTSQRGVANGVAPLNANGLLPQQYVSFTGTDFTITNTQNDLISFSVRNACYLELGNLGFICFDIYLKASNDPRELLFEVTGLPIRLTTCEGVCTGDSGEVGICAVYGMSDGKTYLNVGFSETFSGNYIRGTIIVLA